MDEEFQDLFKIRYNRKDVSVGDILIAQPFLEGRYFSRSVVYIVEHDENGTIGFVMNKVLPYRTFELVEEMEGMNFQVYLGGPVEKNQLYYLHTHPELPDSLPIEKGMYWGGDFDSLVQMMKKGSILPEEVRFLAGYSGWEAGQLKNELEDNSWMVGKMSAEELLRTSSSELWEKSMANLGGRYKIWANFPEDPIMN